MQQTSELYKSIIAGDHFFELSVAFGQKGRLVTEDNELIIFGSFQSSLGQPVSILTDTGGAEGGYGGDRIISCQIHRQIFSGSVPEIGKCVSSEIDVELLQPLSEIPRMAMIRPFVRVCNRAGQKSEWIQKGTFFIDTREIISDGINEPILKIHGYDIILTAEQLYPSTIGVQYPITDRKAIEIIRDHLGVEIDERTWEVVNKNYSVPLPVGFSCREILGNIASMYCGNFITTDTGQLLLVPLNSIPKETGYIVTHLGEVIIFGTVDAGGEDVRLTWHKTA